MSVISTLFVKLSAKTGVFDRKMKGSTKSIRSMQASVLKTQKSMLLFQKSVVALAGAGGLGILVKNLVKTASAAEEIQSKFDTVFKEMSKDANEWADSFGSSVGRSKKDVKAWMSTLQDTFVPLGLARDEAFELSKSLTKLAVDVASFNDQADATVIRDFTSALVGNHETVRKFGIIISEVALKQEAHAQGITKTFSKLTDLEKVQLRYSLLLKGTTDAQGDAIRTGDSYANQIKRLTANIDNLKVVLGTALLPTFNKVVTEINKILEANQNMSDDMLSAQEKIASGFAFLVSNPLHILKATFIDIQSLGLEMLGQITLGLSKMEQQIDKVNNALAGTKIGKKFGLRKTTFGATREADARAMLAAAEALRVESRKMFLDITPLEKVKKFFAELRVDVKKVADNTQDAANSTQDYGDKVETATEKANSGFKKIKDRLKENSDKLKRTGEDVGDSFGRAFETMAFKAGQAGEAIRSLVADIGSLVFRQAITQPLAGFLAPGLSSIFRNLFGGGLAGNQTAIAARGGLASIAEQVQATAFHGGGTVGIDGTPRSIPSSTFAGAPRFHNGLRADEFPAILQRGEEVTPRGGGGAPSVVINNNTGLPIGVGPEGVQIEGEKLVIDIVTKRMATDHRFRSIMGGQR